MKGKFNGGGGGILKLQNEKFKLHPQKCFRIVGFAGQKSDESVESSVIDSHHSKATISEYDAYLLIG
jgi:hypothetical protein